MGRADYMRNEMFRLVKKAVEIEGRLKDLSRQIMETNEELKLVQSEIYAFCRDAWKSKG